MAVKNYSFAHHTGADKPEAFIVNGKRVSRGRFTDLKVKCQMFGVLDCFTSTTRKDGRHVDRCEGRV